MTSEPMSTPVWCSLMLEASSAALIGALNWFPSNDVEDAHMVFEVTPVFQFVPPATCCTTWSFHYAAELRPMAWPPFSCSRVNGSPKHPFPPNQVLMENSVIKVRPTPWPSFSNSCYQVEMQSKKLWLAVSDRLICQHDNCMVIFSSCIINTPKPVVIFNYNWPTVTKYGYMGDVKLQALAPPIGTSNAEHHLFVLKSQGGIVEQEGNNLEILIQGKEMEIFYELLMSEPQGIQYETHLQDHLFLLVLDGCKEDAQAAILVTYLRSPLLCEMLLLHFGGRYLAGWNIQVEQVQVLKMKLSPLESYCKVACPRSHVIEVQEQTSCKAVKNSKACKLSKMRGEENPHPENEMRLTILSSLVLETICSEKGETVVLSATMLEISKLWVQLQWWPTLGDRVNFKFLARCNRFKDGICKERTNLEAGLIHPDLTSWWWFRKSNAPCHIQVVMLANCLIFVREITCNLNESR